MLHGGFWRDAYGPAADGRAVRRPRGARAGRRGTSSTGGSATAAAGRRRSTTSTATLDAPSARRPSRSATRPAGTSRSGRRRVAASRVPSRRPASSTSRTRGLRAQPRRRARAARGADEPGRTPRPRPRRSSRSACPQLLVHGADDDIVPASMSVAYARARPRRRGRGRHCVLPGEGHFEHLDPRSSAGRPMPATGCDRARRCRGARPRRSARALPRPLRDRRIDADLRGRQLARPAAARDGRAHRTRWSRSGASGSSAAGADWIDAARRVGDRARRRACSARSPGEVLACDSTTVNLYKLAAAALELAVPARGRHRRAQLPDRPLRARGLAARRGVELRGLASDPIDGPTPDDVPRAAGRASASSCCRRSRYRSGALADLRRDHRAGHDAGALVLWDLSHSAGAVPGRPRRRAPTSRSAAPTSTSTPGPARPPSSTCAATCQEQLRSPIWGWFGQRDQFAMGPRYDPAAGDRALPRRDAADPRPRRRRGGASSWSPRRASRRCARSRVALTELTVALHDERLAPLGFGLASPRERERRGSHVSVAHPTTAGSICRALIERADVVPDFRAPDVDPARLPAALHALRRRLGRGRPARGPRRERPLPRRGRRAAARHVIRNAEGIGLHEARSPVSVI